MRRQKPRPRQNGARNIILDAAERVFALHGYDGAAMRMIASEANVSQALLHYHFTTKKKLYEAMFERRADVINAFRENGLNELMADSSRTTLEALIDVLLRPSPEWLGSETQSGQYFAAVVGAVSIAPDKRSKALMKRHYDPIARKFIASFMEVMPGLSKRDAVWAYLFALGARLQLSASNERGMRLEGTKRPTKHAVLQQQYIRFVASGIRSLGDARERPSRLDGRRSLA